jgi:hypothetical protein
LIQALGGTSENYNSTESFYDIKVSIKFMDFFSDIVSIIGMDEINNRSDMKGFIELIAMAIGKEVTPSS